MVEGKGDEDAADYTAEFLIAIGDSEGRNPGGNEDWDEMDDAQMEVQNSKSFETIYVFILFIYTIFEILFLYKYDPFQYIRFGVDYRILFGLLDAVFLIFGVILAIVMHFIYVIIIVLKKRIIGTKLEGDKAPLELNPISSEDDEDEDEGESDAIVDLVDSDDENLELSELIEDIAGESEIGARIWSHLPPLRTVILILIPFAMIGTSLWLIETVDFDEILVEETCPFISLGPEHDDCITFPEEVWGLIVASVYGCGIVLLLLGGLLLLVTKTGAVMASIKRNA